MSSEIQQILASVAGQFQGAAPGPPQAKPKRTKKLARKVNRDSNVGGGRVVRRLSAPSPSPSPSPPPLNNHLAQLGAQAAWRGAGAAAAAPNPTAAPVVGGAPQPTTKESVLLQQQQQQQQGRPQPRENNHLAQLGVQAAWRGAGAAADAPNPTAAPVVGGAPQPTTGASVLPQQQQQQGQPRPRENNHLAQLGVQAAWQGAGAAALAPNPTAAPVVGVAAQPTTGASILPQQQQQQQGQPQPHPKHQLQQQPPLAMVPGQPVAVPAAASIATYRQHHQHPASAVPVLATTQPQPQQHHWQSIAAVPALASAPQALQTQQLQPQPPLQTNLPVGTAAQGLEGIVRGQQQVQTQTQSQAQPMQVQQIQQQQRQQQPVPQIPMQQQQTMRQPMSQVAQPPEHERPTTAKRSMKVGGADPAKATAGTPASAAPAAAAAASTPPPAAKPAEAATGTSSSQRSASLERSSPPPSEPPEQHLKFLEWGVQQLQTRIGRLDEYRLEWEGRREADELAARNASLRAEIQEKERTYAAEIAEQNRKGEAAMAAAAAATEAALRAARAEVDAGRAKLRRKVTRAKAREAKVVGYRGLKAGMALATVGYRMKASAALDAADANGIYAWREVQDLKWKLRAEREEERAFQVLQLEELRRRLGRVDEGREFDYVMRSADGSAHRGKPPPPPSSKSVEVSGRRMVDLLRRDIANLECMADSLRAQEREQSLGF